METVWTLEKIAYAIKNDLEAGLKGTANYNFSMEQMVHEIIAERNMLIAQLGQAGTLDTFGLTQEVNCVQLDCEDLGLCCDVDTKSPKLHFDLPLAHHIEYIGTPQYNKPFKIYKDNASIYNDFKDSRLVSRPYIRLRQNKGRLHGFIYNPPTFNLKYISVKAVFENPTDVNFECCSFNMLTDRFPVPAEMITMIITNIVGRWSSWYYRFQGQRFPNTQQSIG
jgi:hypothetical protein